MSARDELDRRLADWMAETASSSPPAGRFEQAMEATARRRPRPRWLAAFGSDWVGDAAPRRLEWGWPGARRNLLVVATLALLVAAAVVGTVLVGSQLLRPQPDPLPGHLGSLVYTLDGEIYLADANGANARRVAWSGGGASYGDPVWAPDGRHFRFIGLDEATGTQQVAVLIGDAKGRVDTTIPGIWIDATWSPDSTRLLAWIQESGLDSTRVGIYGTDGTQQASLDLPAGYLRFRESGALWAPDGRSVWVEITNDRPGFSSEYWQLPIDGSAPRRLAADDVIAEADLSVSFSRDGRHLLGMSPISLIVANADGTNRRAVGPGGVSSAAWSPTGTEVAYITESRDELRVIDVSNGNERVVAGLRDDSSLIGWSPAGDRILLLGVDQKNRSSLWTVDVDTGELALLVEGAESGAWQRDR